MGQSISFTTKGVSGYMLLFFKAENEKFLTKYLLFNLSSGKQLSVDISA
jgi:hypothetical protein